MADNKVFILFEEIKTMLEGMKSRLEELPKVIDRRQPDGNDKLDLSRLRMQWQKLQEPIQNRLKACWQGNGRLTQKHLT